MAQAMMEVTKWEGAQLNHMYLMDSDKAIAYSKWGIDAPFYFSQPMRIDTRRRKFVEVKDHPFTIEKKASVVTVSGSKGATYEVDVDAKTCSCPSYKFRRVCKHVQEFCK